MLIPQIENIFGSSGQTSGTQNQLINLLERNITIIYTPRNQEIQTSRKYLWFVNLRWIPSKRFCE